VPKIRKLMKLNVLYVKMWCLVKHRGILFSYTELYITTDLTFIKVSYGQLQVSTIWYSVHIKGIQTQQNYVKYDCEAERARDAGARQPELCTVALSVCGSSIWNLLHVTLLAHRILRWLLDFWKICGHLLWSHNKLEHKWREGRWQVYLLIYA
jgi:hypothetical protein